MASNGRGLIVGAVLGAMGFLLGMVYLIYGAIAHDEPYLLGIVIGVGSFMLFPIVGLIVDMRSAKVHATHGQPNVSKTMRYEGGAVFYCPVCHANLGANPPRICPECGYRRE